MAHKTDNWKDALLKVREGLKEANAPVEKTEDELISEEIDGLLNDFEETPAEEATEEDAPAPEEQPSLPCATDADCSKFDSGAICAQWDGVKDCTIPCTEESDCDIPANGGFSVVFMT